MKHWMILLGMSLCVMQGHAQNNKKDPLADFRKAVYDDFQSFRKQIYEEFADFVANPWVAFKENKPIPLPKEEPKPPVTIPEKDKEKPVEDKPIVINEVVKPIPVVPQPSPIEPIKEVPVKEEKYVDFTFFGTSAKVRFDIANKIQLKGITERDVSLALKKIDAKQYDNMLLDCLALRDSLLLSDWAYIQMLKSLAYQIEGKKTNEAALLLAYLYMQSGYKMRLASDGTHLYMLYGSKHQIFEEASYSVDGELYYGIEKLPVTLMICKAAFPKERSMSLLINTNQKFKEDSSTPRLISSFSYPDFKAQVSVNKNLMEFYQTYPTSMLDGNMMTRWAMYANTPMEKSVRNQLYQQLKEKLNGMSQLKAVNKILNWVQTGFEYEYDDKVWGGDRAFFAEETLFYPYCDCEDRAILLTRLVRDLLGLKCILVFYPGHLASAVEFTEADVKGDYIQYDGHKYVIADGTYINAPVGRTMPSMDNETAKVILLE